ncbi:MAG: hypothetical protein U0169_04400 [Polyangiaceae bacterium]
MKSRMLAWCAVALFSLQGCTAETTESAGETEGAQSSAGVAPDHLKFERNDLRLDGAFTEVELTRVPGGPDVYHAVVRLTVDPRTGAGPATEVLVDDKLECAFTFTPAGEIQKIACAHDYRPVDGALIELTLAYRAGRPAVGPIPTKLRMAFAGFGAPPSDETKQLDELTRIE